MSDCSVIIPVYNHAGLTRRCLERVLELGSGSGSMEVIVVDDASTDETPRLLAEYAPRVRSIRHERNQGFARSCNDGAAAARTDNLVFLNNDTFPHPGWVDALLAHAGRHPNAGAIGARLIFPDGRIQHAGIACDAQGEPRHIYLGLEANHPAVTRSRRFRMVTGACLLMPAEVFRGLNGFDIAYRNGYEDVDLCLRVGGTGREVWYCAEAVVEHFESVTEGRGVHDDQNRRVFMERWQAVCEPEDWKYYLEDGLIRLTYGASALLSIEVEPPFAVARSTAQQARLEEELEVRTAQVGILLRENLAQKVRLLESGC